MSFCCKKLEFEHFSFMDLYLSAQQHVVLLLKQSGNCSSWCHTDWKRSCHCLHQDSAWSDWLWNHKLWKMWAAGFHLLADFFKRLCDSERAACVFTATWVLRLWWHKQIKPRWRTFTPLFEFQRQTTVWNARPTHECLSYSAMCICHM